MQLVVAGALGLGGGTFSTTATLAAMTMLLLLEVGWGVQWMVCLMAGSWVRELRHLMGGREMQDRNAAST
jgi:hypothetical protein